MTDEELCRALRWKAGAYAKQAADRIEALVRELEICRMAQVVMENTVVDAEARLAKAVDALREIYGSGDATGRNPQLMANIARDTLAEIEGKKDE